MTVNEYIPFLSEIKDVIQHTEIEFTFRMAYQGEVKPGQFFEVSLPKYGEAPISVSGIGEDDVDLTIRRVGKVTNEIFNHYKGQHLFLRGPYGNGFDVANYEGKELIVVAGGTGLSPVRGVVDYFATDASRSNGFTLITGFKSPEDVLFKADLAKWRETSEVILTVDNVQVIVVGPPLMMHFTVQEFLKRGIAEQYIWISQERKMCCGIGKCGHCKIDDTYICLEGPVFNYTKGKDLID